MENTLWTILACNKKYMIIRDKDHPELKWHFPQLSIQDGLLGTTESMRHLHSCFGIDPVECNPLFEQDRIHVVYCCKWGGHPQRITSNIAKIDFLGIEDLFDLSNNLSQTLVELLPHVSFYLRH